MYIYFSHLIFIIDENDVEPQEETQLLWVHVQAYSILIDLNQHNRTDVCPSLFYYLK